MRKLSIDEYIVDTLMGDLCGHDRQPSAFLVYLFLYCKTKSIKQRSIEISLRNIAESTGLSKRSVQNAINRLHDRQLVGIARRGITDIPRYSVFSPWLR